MIDQIALNGQCPHLSGFDANASQCSLYKFGNCPEHCPHDVGTIWSNILGSGTWQHQCIKLLCSIYKNCTIYMCRWLGDSNLHPNKDSKIFLLTLHHLNLCIYSLKSAVLLIFCQYSLADNCVLTPLHICTYELELIMRPNPHWQKAEITWNNAELMQHQGLLSKFSKSPSPLGDRLSI